MIDKEHDRILRSLTRAQLRLLWDESMHGIAIFGGNKTPCQKLVDLKLARWRISHGHGVAFVIKLTELGEAVRASYLEHGIVDRRTVAGRQPRWK